MPTTTLTSVPLPAHWDELSLEQTPNQQQLNNIKAHLDLIIQALEALTARRKGCWDGRRRRP